MHIGLERVQLCRASPLHGAALMRPLFNHEELIEISRMSRFMCLKRRHTAGANSPLGIQRSPRLQDCELFTRSPNAWLTVVSDMF